MKRSLIVLICGLCVSFFMTSCGTSDRSQTKTQIDTKTEVQEEQLPETHYTESQTTMGNYMNDVRANISGGWIYTISWNETASLFLKMRIDGSDEKIIRKEYPSYININGEYIYFVSENDDSSNIYRCRLGGGKEKLIIKNATYMQIVDDSIFYCKCDNSSKMINYCKSDLSGNNEEIVIDREIYYPYVVDNYLFYQDDNDKETIHRYSFATKEDIQITKENTYKYILNDDYMYCVMKNGPVKDDDRTCYLAKVNLKTFECQTLYEGVTADGLNIKDDKLFFVNQNDGNRIYSIDKNGENISLVTQDGRCSHLCIYDDKLIYIQWGADYESLKDTYICNLDGSNKKSLLK